MRDALTLRRIAWTVLFLAGLALAFQAIAGNLDEIAAAGELLSRPLVVWVVVAVGAEVVSYTFYGAGLQRLLRSGGASLGVGPLTGLALAGQALANALPAGAALAVLV
ncbi:MAG: hypothetical protein M3155_09405, partial [Actinomycetota bacterium]|nr:hypothetical protein [Actinomycetota bacterium]